MILLLLLVSSAQADMHQAWDRARGFCLAPGRGTHYKPDLAPLDPVNHIDSLRTLLFSRQVSVELPVPSDGDEYAVYKDMRASLQEFFERESLDVWQRHCAVQCVAAYYFNNVRSGDPESRFREASGMCTEASELAESLSRSLGLNATRVLNGTYSWLLAGGDERALHMFTLVTIEGRRYVLNNNWQGDICQFRFSAHWRTHQER